MNEYLIVLLSSLFCAHVCATTSSKYGFSLQLRNICISFGLDYNGIKKALENIRKSINFDLSFSAKIQMNTKWENDKIDAFKSFGERAEKQIVNDFETSHLFATQGKCEKDRAGCYGFSILNTLLSVSLRAKDLRLSLENVTTSQPTIEDINETWLLAEYLKGEREDCAGLDQECRALRFLEVQYRGVVRKTVDEDRIASSQIGDGSVLSYVEGFLKTRLYLSSAPSVWAMLYVMLRCGFTDAARGFAKLNIPNIGESLGFFIGDYDKETNTELLALYKAVARTETDIYKVLVLNVLGGDDVVRGDVVRGALRDTHDRAWYYLLLHRRGVLSTSAMHEAIEKDTTKFTSPLAVAQTRLATFQIDKAITSLLNTETYFVDAVHLAIVLRPENCANLIHAYAVMFRTLFTPELAVRYTLLCPKSEHKNAIANLTVQVAENGIIGLQNFVGTKKGLNDPLYKKSPLEKYITNENDLNEILCLAADKCNELSVDRQKEAAWLYERAGQYENALIQIVKLYSRVVSFSKDNSEKSEIQALATTAKRTVLPMSLYSIHFIPMSADPNEITRLAEKFAMMPPALCEILPTVLLYTMKAIRYRWREGKGNTSLTTEMTNIARNIVLFVGMLSIPFPPNVAYKLIEMQTEIASNLQ